jgi:nitroreductase
MDIPVESWYDAIEKRHSVRKYSEEPVSSDLMAEIEQTCDEFRPFPGARAVLVKEPKSDVFKGLIGPILKVKRAPHYVAFVGDTEVNHFETALGYLGEGIILEATTRGLNTCWVTGFFRPDRTEEDVAIRDGEQIVGISPIGYAEESKDRVGNKREHDRKSLSKLIESGNLDKEWVKEALEAARLAPSAVNRQPWRFEVSSTSITISYGGLIDWGSSKAIDCGIAMLHVELGARHAGTVGEWVLLPKPEVARFDIIA